MKNKKNKGKYITEEEWERIESEREELMEYRSISEGNRFYLQDRLYTLSKYEEFGRLKDIYDLLKEFHDHEFPVEYALKKLQQYEELGEPTELAQMKIRSVELEANTIKLKRYESIGTLDECKEYKITTYQTNNYYIKPEIASTKDIIECPLCKTKLKLSEEDLKIIKAKKIKCFNFPLKDTMVYCNNCHRHFMYQYNKTAQDETIDPNEDENTSETTTFSTAPELSITKDFIVFNYELHCHICDTEMLLNDSQIDELNRGSIIELCCSDCGTHYLVYRAESGQLFYQKMYK